MKFLSVAEVTELHLKSIREHGGRDGVRDERLLDSAVASPMASFGGKFLHVTTSDKAAALWLSLSKNHPFVDGNKRTALAAVLLFLEVNGCPLLGANYKELLTTSLRIASGELDKDDIADWIERQLPPSA